MDLVNYLAAQGLGLVVGVNLFPVREEEGIGVPTDSVFVYGMPGGPPDRNNDTRIEQRYAMLHIEVRDGTRGGADSMARNIYEELQAAELGGDYLDFHSLQSEPSTAISPQTGRYLVSMSYEAVYESDIR